MAPADVIRATMSEVALGPGGSPAAFVAIVATALVALLSMLVHRRLRVRHGKGGAAREDGMVPPPAPLLPCIRERASVFPRSYARGRTVPKETVDRLLEAAMWAPFHGPKAPWRFVVLGKTAAADMQRMTLKYYDAHWRDYVWATKAAAGGARTGTEEQNYQSWRARTEAEIDGRWGPVSYMLAIVVRRQAGSRRMPLWEEECATACAVQNMHLQASTQPELACYWSSWHSGARDSAEMRAFLGMEEEDKCLGFFIVAACEKGMKMRRSRRMQDHMSVEWRD